MSATFTDDDLQNGTFSTGSHTNDIRYVTNTISRANNTLAELSYKLRILVEYIIQLEADQTKLTIEKKEADRVAQYGHAIAAKTIQRWYKEYLYNPRDGPLYLRAKLRFDKLKIRET